jgi:RNA polymerase sigma-70 factor (ECF subfamily)
VTDRFRTTRWSVVLDAGAGGEESRHALATLCENYWYPLYAYARRRGADPDDAADLVQGFLTSLIEKGHLAAADPGRGRFRGFLATSFSRYAGGERRREEAQKRGGGRARLSIDAAVGESRYRLEPADESATPERLFERRWALALLDRALGALRDEWVRADRAERFEELSVFLGGVSPTPTHAEAAERLGMSTGAVKVAVHRLRKRYREVLRATVLETVSSEDAVEDEIRRLVEAVRT